MFENNLEKLLAPFVDSETQMGILLGDPFGPSWRNADLEQRLQGRLGASYSFYKSIVGRMNEVLADIQQMLGLENGQVRRLVPFPLSSSIKLRPYPLPPRSSLPFFDMTFLTKCYDRLSISGRTGT